MQLYYYCALQAWTVGPVTVQKKVWGSFIYWLESLECPSRSRKQLRVSEVLIFYPVSFNLIVVSDVLGFFVDLLNAGKLQSFITVIKLIRWIGVPTASSLRSKRWRYSSLHLAGRPKNPRLFVRCSFHSVNLLFQNPV